MFSFQNISHSAFNLAQGTTQKLDEMLADA